jgi:hypothetical protein
MVTRRPPGRGDAAVHAVIGVGSDETTNRSLGCCAVGIKGSVKQKSITALEGAEGNVRQVCLER